MKSTHSSDPRETSHTVPSSRLMARMNGTLFYTVGAACLIEAAAAVHAKRLLAAFGPETAFGQWIDQCWLPEKLERARLLQEYAIGIWPELDWPRACAEFEQAASRARGVPGTHRRAHEALGHCVAAAQASLFYGVMSVWAEDVHVRQLTRRSGVAERASFEHFKDAFELAHRQERLGLWATFREALARVIYARDNIVRAAFEMLQSHWSGTPPFPDLSYAEFLRRAGSVARRDGMLAWPHRVLLRPWFRQPTALRVRVTSDAMKWRARESDRPFRSKVGASVHAAHAA